MVATERSINDYILSQLLRFALPRPIDQGVGPVATVRDADDGVGLGATRKAGPKRLVPAVVVAVGLLAGGWFMGTGRRDTSAVAATTSTTAEHLRTVVLEPVTLNLADGSYLRVQLALGLLGEDNGEGVEEDPASEAKWSKALDRVITVFGSRTKGDLTAAGRAVAKAEAAREIGGLYPDQVAEVYFTQFVVQ